MIQGCNLSTLKGKDAIVKACSDITKKSLKKMWIVILKKCKKGIYWIAIYRIRSCQVLLNYQNYAKFVRDKISVIFYFLKF